MQIILNARESNTEQIPKGTLMNTKKCQILHMDHDVYDLFDLFLSEG
jgi:hypothetical protein